MSEEKNALSSFGALFGFTDCIFGDAIDSNHFTNFVFLKEVGFSFTNYLSFFSR